VAKRTRIVRATAEEIAHRVATGEDKTDWQRVRAMSQEEVERLAEEEGGALPEGWESTIELGIPEPKQGVHIRLDPAVLRWFKAQGRGYQTRINSVLRALVEARRGAESRAHKSK